MKTGKTTLSKKINKGQRKKGKHLEEVSKRVAPFIHDPLFTTEEAADYLRIGYSTLKLLRRRGSGPRFVRIGTKTALYRQSALDAFLDEMTAA